MDVTSSNVFGSPVYIWENGSTNEDRSGLVSGTYTVTVTYGPGCSLVQSFTVTQPSVLIATDTKTNITCKGTATGTVSMSPSGGTPPFPYLWNNGNTNQNRSSLSQGTYTVTVSDSKSCTATASFTITQPATSLIINTNKTNVRCYNGLTGSITVSPSGGIAPYTYSWNTIPVKTTASVSGLGAGVYTCTVTDAAGCIKNTTLTISQPALMSVIPTQTNVTFPGGNDGTASVSVSGGTPGYSYSWSTVPVKTTASVTGLTAGVYKCTVLHSKGCQKKLLFTITQPLSREMDDAGDWQIVMSPNPTEGRLNLLFNSAQSEEFIFELTDLTGRLVYVSSGRSVKGENLLNYNLEDLNKGVYLVKVRNGNQLKTMRLILQ